MVFCSPWSVVAPVFRLGVSLLLLLLLSQAGVVVSEAQGWTWGVGVLTVRGPRQRGSLAQWNRGTHTTHQPPSGGHSCLGRWVIWSWTAVDLWETAGREKKRRREKKGLALSEKTNSFVTTWSDSVGACCFDVAGLVWSPYWHVSAIVLLADVLFQDTGVDVDWLQSTGNIMTCGEGRVGNTEGRWRASGN